MAAFVQEAGAGAFNSGTAASTFTVSISSATTAGNTLVLLVKTSSGATLTSVSDTQGNSWAVDLAGAGSTGPNSAAAHAYLTTALGTTDSVTFTISAAENGVVAELAELSGVVQTSPLDVTAVDAPTAKAGTISIGPTGSAQAGDIALTMAAEGGTAPANPLVWTVPSGWTEVAPAGAGTANFMDGAVQVFASGGAVSATWSVSRTNQLMSGLIVTYRTASSALSASGSGSLSLSGAASGQVTLAASGSGSLSLSGSAIGQVTLPATGTGSLSLSGSAIGQFAATGAGSLSLSGAAVGQLGQFAATGTGSLSLSGAAVGQLGQFAATGTGSLSLSGAAVGQLVLSASGSGSLSLSGSAIGHFAATGAGSLSLSGAAVGQLGQFAATGAGSLSLSGAAVGQLGQFAATGTGSLSLSGAAVGQLVL